MDTNTTHLRNFRSSRYSTQ
ncbi:hypothetical protein Ahy_A06g026615 isoform C [Arachis hypogaea]|uniref:Uncharacterized protein n=1 Tax=Arachis hypogaea TaxID=3818 RepID=A0A445CL49_ARAHY|nr:hypothetical protein Ahy_A06g026615 isoform C [Arachis hypogaea]